MVFLSSFESVVSKLEKRSKNRASKKFVFDTRATAKERITRISSNNYNFLIFLSFAFGKDEVGGSNPPSSSNIFRLNRKVWADFVMFLQLFACFCNLEKRPRYQKTAFYQLTDQLFGKWKARYPLRHKGLRVFAFPTGNQLAVYTRSIAIAASSEVLRPLT